MRLVLSILFILCLHPMLAQETDIETDRPDQTETPAIVPLKHFQVEMGFNFEKDGKDMQFVHPTTLWKVGIFKNTELRVITEVLGTRGDRNKFRVGLVPVQLGFKTAICEEKKARPKISFIAHVAIPWLSTKPERTKYIAPNFRFTLNHSLPKNISLGYNIGAEWDGFSAQPSFVYTIANGFKLSPRWYYYYEFFGNIPIGEKSTHTVDNGVAFLIRPNVQIDLSGGVQLYPDFKSAYASLGLSFRLPN